MKNLQLRRAWLLVFAIYLSSGCAHHFGPDVEECIVDVTSGGFDCAKANGTHRFMSFKDEINLSTDFQLECTTPTSAEEMLKACKNHQLLYVPFCMLRHDLISMTCFPPDGAMVYNIELSAADGYPCLSKQNYDRLAERCKK